MSALSPIIFALLVGGLLKALKLFSDDMWRALEKAGYYLFLPALIVKVLAGATIENDAFSFVAVLLLAQLAVTLISCLCLISVRSIGPETGSIIQANVRWNTFIALAIADALLGGAGLVLVAIASAVMIPVANIVSVGALTYYAGHDRPSCRRLLAQLIRNPLLIACVIGLCLAMSQFTLPTALTHTLDIMSRPAITLGLLTAGAGLALSALSANLRLVLTWSSFRLLAFPLAAIVLGLAFGLTEDQLIVSVICCATPTAVSGYILAKELGGDAELSANLISVQSALSILTLPALLTLTTRLIQSTYF
jgi:predicted permease